MDWKYEHFAQEAVFQAEREIVYEAVRAFAQDWLAGWSLSETPDGLETKGLSAGHRATATFRFEPASGGTKVTVELQVERASGLGFMLVDFDGYYDGQIRKWLQALPWWVQQKQNAASESKGRPGQAAPAGPPIPNPSRVAELFLGCVVISFLLGVSIFAIAALIGLLTGNLFLAGRGSSSTIHRLWARISSAIILLFFGWVAFRIWKPKKGNRGTGWLPPP